MSDQSNDGNNDSEQQDASQSFEGENNEEQIKEESIYEEDSKYSPKKEDDDDEDYSEEIKKRKKGKVKTKEEYQEDDDNSDDSRPKKKKRKPSKGKALGNKRKREGAKKKKKKSKKGDVAQFFDMNAEESSGSDSDNGGEEITGEQQKLLIAEYDKRKNVNRLKYDSSDEEEIIEDINRRAKERNLQEAEEDFMNYGMEQPRIDDPKLWQIKVEQGKERDTIKNLYCKIMENMKYYKNKIFSIFNFDSMKGYIYIEAFKESEVKEAIRGISCLKSNLIKVVPLEQMSKLFNYDKLKVPKFKKGQFVRMKTGVYEGDIAQVISVDDPFSKIKIKLIPRLPSKNDENIKKDNIGEQNKKLKKKIKPMQKFFVPEEFPGCEERPIHGEKNYIWNKMTFKDGFLIKFVKATALSDEKVIPKISELKMFTKNKDKNEMFNQNNMFIKETFDQNECNKKFSRGERVIVNLSNDLFHATVVKYFDNSTVQVTAIETDGTPQLFYVPEISLSKDYLPGDFVVITKENLFGKKGYIVDVFEKDGQVVVYDEDSREKHKVSFEDILPINEFKINEERNPIYRNGDLVKILSSGRVCYVLKSTTSVLQLLDTRNELKKATPRDVIKYSSYNNKGSDGKGNPIKRDDKVQVIKGKFKGTKAVIKNIYEKWVFLQCNEIQQNNGIFVEISDNLQIFGYELLDIANERRLVNQFSYEDNRAFIGKEVEIIKGPYKGYKGLVKDAKETSLRVELGFKAKTVDIPREYIKDDKEAEPNYGMVSTPAYHQQAKTPSYYGSQRPFSNTPNVYGGNDADNNWG